MLPYLEDRGKKKQDLDCKQTKFWICSVKINLSRTWLAFLFCMYFCFFKHPMCLLYHPPPCPPLSAPAPAGWWRKEEPRWRSRRSPGRAGRWPPAAAGLSRSPDPPQTPAKWFWSSTGRPRCSAGWGSVKSGSPWHWSRGEEETVHMEDPHFSNVLRAVFALILLLLWEKPFFWSPYQTGGPWINLGWLILICLPLHHTHKGLKGKKNPHLQFQQVSRSLTWARKVF